MSSSISFTSGGIDVSSIVTQLIDAEKAPLTILQNRKDAVTQQQTALAGIKTGLSALQSSAAAIVSGGLAHLTTSTSSAAVTASITGTARAGAVSFTVDRLAAADGMRTANALASSSATVTNASSLALSSTSVALGVTGINADPAVAAGKYTVSVTRSSAGASITATSALATSTTIDGTNNSLSLTVDGVAKSVTIASGTYTRSGLVTAVQTALDAAGASVTASLGSGNELKLTTTHEGSAAALGLTAGSALTALGLPVTYPATVGIDGIIKIGSNPLVTVLSAGMGETVAVSTGSGNLNLTLGAGLRIGDASVAVVSTGDRSLSAVTDAINGAGVGVTAAAVNAAPNQWFLQLNSSATGTSRAIATDPNAFAPAGGTINTSVASDAKITIGNGPGAYSIVASGNTFANVLPGVSFTATQQSATPVTVSVNRDDSATASAIDALVGQANDLIKAVGDQTKYDAANRIVAPLADNSTVRGLADQVRSAITSLVGGMSGSSVTTAADIGINVQRDGTIKFDKSVFLAKAAADPDAVDKLFSRHATVPTGLTFAGASDSTVPGSYAVNITQAATRATSGEVVVGGSVAGQTIGVRVGTTIATYAAAAGATASQIVSGLNDAIARAGLKVTAELTSGGGVKLTSGQFGGGGSFDTNLDTTGAGSWATNTGTDVVGTINGTNAIGVGNHLYLLDLGTSPARGLKIDVGEGVTGAVGNIGYQPGIAARLVNLGTGLTGLLGPLTTAASSFDQKVTDFNKQIDDFNARLVIKEANLRRQWTAVQTALTSLQNQQSWLTQQTATKSG